jgi:integrase
MDKYTKRWLEYYPVDQHKRRLAALERFHAVVKREPAALLEQARRRLLRGQAPEELEDALRKYYKSLIDAERARSTAAQWYAVVRSYFTKNYVSLPRFPRDMTVQPVYETTDVLSQKEVKRMVQARKNSVRDQLVIAFLAQTGQRIGVLTAMKRDMIKRKGSYGLVVVPGGPFQNRKGRNVNKYLVHYKFVIGKDTMKLIDRLPECEGGWLLDISERQMARIVSEAAEDIGIQEGIPTRVRERSLHRVHPDVFRKYWKGQMRLGGVKDPDLLGFLTGHRLQYGGTCHEFPDEYVLQAYKKAQRKLRVLRR